MAEAGLITAQLSPSPGLGERHLFRRNWPVSKSLPAVPVTAAAAAAGTPTSGFCLMPAACTTVIY